MTSHADLVDASADTSRRNAAMDPAARVRDEARGALDALAGGEAGAVTHTQLLGFRDLSKRA